MKNQTRGRTWLWLMLLLGVTIVGVGAVTLTHIRSSSASVSHIQAHASDFDGKVVTLRGKVTDERFTVQGRGGYLINDGTGTIGVLTSTGAPAKGEQVTVTGKVKVLLQTPMGDMIIIDASQG